MLKIASTSQQGSIKWTRENIEQVKHEDNLVLQKTQDLKTYMANRMRENVQTLLKIIEEDINANKEEMNEKIPSFIQEYQQKQSQLTTQNNQLKTQIQELQGIHAKNVQLEGNLSE